MKSLVKVAFVAAALLILSLPLFGQEWVGDGTVLKDSPPADLPSDQWVGEVTGAPSAPPQGEQQVGVVTGEPKVAEKSAQEAPESLPPIPPAYAWQTRPGVEEATRQVLGGQFALKEHSQTRPTTSTSTSSVKIFRTECVIEKPVVKGPTPVNIFNFTAPPNEPLPAAEIREERKNSMGWMIVVGLLIVAAATAAIVGIIVANGRRVQEELTRQAQAANTAAALGNQTPFSPAPGRLVSIASTIFPTGGGIMRATSDERPVPAPPAAPAPAPAGPPPYAVMMTAPAWQAHVNAQQVHLAPPAAGANP